MKNAVRTDCEFWVPLQNDAEWRLCSWSISACSNPPEFAMKRQLLERQKEIKQLLQSAVDFSEEHSEVMKEYVLEGQPLLVKQWCSIETAGSVSVAQ